LFVGDVNASDFSSPNALSMVLFVAVTFLGVIILLNMLIANVLESYEKSIQRSKKLFGRTRVALVAKSILLEDVFLRSKSRLSVIARLCFGLVFIYIVGYLIAWSIKTLLDAEPFFGLVLVVSLISVFLLLYFLTLVLVHYFKVFRVIAPQSYFLRLVEGTFQCFFVAPATYLTLFLLDARGPYVLSEDLDVTAASGTKPDSTRRQRSTTNMLRSLERRLEHFEDARREHFEAARRADFEALKQLLEERDAKHQDELQAMERRILEVSNKQ
jgi:hypothetical protein